MRFSKDVCAAPPLLKCPSAPLQSFGDFALDLFQADVQFYLKAFVFLHKCSPLPFPDDILDSESALISFYSLFYIVGIN